MGNTVRVRDAHRTHAGHAAHQELVEAAIVHGNRVMKLRV
jgi:hypothetical protein